MKTKAKVGIIGIGKIAQITHLPIWKKLDNVEIVGVCDTNERVARGIAEKYKIKHVFKKAEDLLKIDELDAVDICTPTQTHKDLAVAALEQGKHVLVEKPMARNYAEAQKMVESAIKHKKHLMVGMNVRFRQDARVLRTFTQKGELGDIFYAKAGWLQRRESLAHKAWKLKKELAGGGVFMDLGIQMLDASLWLIGDPKAKSVTASLYNNISGLPVEDSASVFIRLENNTTLTIEVSWTLLSENDFFYTNLFGKNGGALLNPLRVHKELHGSLVNVTPAKSDSLQNIYKKSYENEIVHFVNRLSNDKIIPEEYEAMLERMKIVDAVYKSAKTGKEVIVNS